MKEYQETIIIAAAIGIPYTSLVGAYSFWLAHSNPVLIYILMPGAFLGTRLGFSGGTLWIIIMIVQLIFYLGLALAIKSSVKKVLAHVRQLYKTEDN